VVESKLKKDATDISGLLRETRTTHQKAGKQTIVTTDTFTYDHSGKVLKQTQTINGSAIEVIAENHYDELGRLDRKEVGGNPLVKLQVVDYKYNIRGWLTDINDIANLGTKDVFAFKIRYNTPTSGTPLFNGNISQTEWKTKSINSTNNLVSTKYSYTYDALNRIFSAIDNTNRYNLTSVSYDKNGNILSLNRKGHLNSAATSFGVMDNLIYTYDSGNKLKKVLDNGNDTYGFKDGANQSTEYTYDGNGNMKTDANKGITSILYNHLNLPTEVKFNNSNTKKINYTYAADGTKLRKVVNDNGNVTTTDYAGNYVYENNDLQFFSHAEGYVKATISQAKVYPQQYASFDYVYQYKDHLGNVRLSYSDSDGNGTISQSEIIEENNYYPFGLKHKGYNTNVSSSGNSVAQKFKYNGVELEESLGLNLYEMDKRQYDPAIGRFTGIDPITHHQFTPYRAFDNNPVLWTDPTGADSYRYDWNSNDGTYINTTTGEKTKDWKTAISETTEELGIDSKPLTKKALGSLLGTTDSEKIGDRFEQLFQKWGKENYLTFIVPNEHFESDDFGDVLPDGVSVGTTLFGRTGVAPNIAFWDAKATGKSVWGATFLKNRQLKAYIQVLAKLNVKNTTKNVLIYVTTSDVVNVNAVRKYAEKRGVSFRHIVAYSEWGFLGRYLVFKERVWKGVPKGGGKPYTDRTFTSNQEAVKID